MANNEADNAVKYTLFVLGPGAVGKTCLTIRFINDDFKKEYSPTIEDFHRKTITVDKVGAFNLEIYDTAGQEEFNTMQDEYYRTGDGFLLVYSTTSSNSYHQLQGVYNKLITARRAVNAAAPIPPIVVAANKCDLVDERKVTKAEGQKLAKSWGSPFFETSAITRHNNLAVFEELVRQIESKKRNAASQSVVMEQPSSGCCIIL